MKRITMTATLPRHRDRLGHRLAAVLLGVSAVMVPPAAAAQSGAYKAQRFDVAVTPRHGDLDVTETITFQFQSGTFRRVWRDIPSRRTDGIEIVEARMDGQAMPRGEGEGRITVAGSSRVRVQWNFAPAGASVHTFALHYLARGVIYREDGRDVLRWRALPTEHRYAIDASRIVFTADDGDALPLETHRVGRSALFTRPPGIVVEAEDIASNGSIAAEVRFPAGTLIDASPQWQQREMQAAALAPRWLAGGIAVLVLGFVVLAGARQGYTAPERSAADVPVVSPPEPPLPAAMAAALASRGRVSVHDALSTLVDLADRGVLTVREVAKAFGGRAYELSQVAGRHELLDHEAAALDIAFGGHGEDVSLARARRRLVRRGASFVAALNADLDERGLLDRTRQESRSRIAVVSLAMLPAAVLAAAGCAALVQRYGGWPFLLPLALVVVALAGLAITASMSTLSDAGAIEAARWQAFRSHLKSLTARGREGTAAPRPRWIVYAIAFGLSAQWSRYLRRHPEQAPPWFVASAPGDSVAFAAFIGSQAALHGGHAGSGGSAAGGGGSGAG